MLKKIKTSIYIIIISHIYLKWIYVFSIRICLKGLIILFPQKKKISSNYFYLYLFFNILIY
jgi:hypothetical protein